MNQSSVNMVTTDDVAPHLPAMFPRIEHANMQLPVSFP